MNKEEKESEKSKKKKKKKDKGLQIKDIQLDEKRKKTI